MIKRLAYRILSCLLALLLIATQVAANNWVMNSYRFGVAGCVAGTLTISSLGSGTSTTSGATVSTGATITAAVNDWLVLLIAADNGGTSGASAISSVSATGGMAWDQRAIVNRTAASAANDGTTLGMFTLNLTSALSSDTVTVNFSPNIASKAIQVYKVTPSAGSCVAIVGVDTVGTTGSSTTPSASAVTVTNGDVIFGATAQEANSGSTADSDTTNGSWSSLLERTATPGGGTSAASQLSQYKTVTATGSQTYNTGIGAAADWAASYLILRAGPQPSCIPGALAMAEVDGASSTSSGATLSTSGTVTASIGDMLVAVVSADNNGTAGVSSISGISATGGNAWTNQVTINRTPGAAAADGATVAFYTSTITSALASATVTVNFSPSTTAKAVSISRVQPSSASCVTIVGVDTVGATGSLTSPTYTTPSITSGDTVVAGLAVEDRFNTSAGDSDTTNGNWSTLVARFADTGTATTSMGLAEQHKTVTATGTQSWTVTGPGAARDFAATSITLRAGPMPLLTNTDIERQASPAGAAVTFTAANTGVADPNRTTLIAACGSDNATVFSITGLTVGGNAAAKQSENSAASVRGYCSIWSYANPTGGSADIVVTYSETLTGVASIVVWAAYNLASVTAAAANNAAAGSGAVLTLSLNVQVDDRVVAACTGETSTGNMTWVGLNELVDDISSGGIHSAADTIAVAAATPLTISCDNSDSGSSTGGASAAFR